MFVATRKFSFEFSQMPFLSTIMNLYSKCVVRNLYQFFIKLSDNVDKDSNDFNENSYYLFGWVASFVDLNVISLKPRYLNWAGVFIWNVRYGILGVFHQINMISALREISCAKCLKWNNLTYITLCAVAHIKIKRRNAIVNKNQKTCNHWVRNI